MHVCACILCAYVCIYKIGTLCKDTYDYLSGVVGLTEREGENWEDPRKEKKNALKMCEITFIHLC